ncbi:hypothetical protein FRACYDRAFT_268939 [Fragilariopsis cylindrus CCMP1102]|uniref:Uncharacterized protein n=1 Tax=Fragilariopsis cylindrus CCMP1102 TaxID=635003 RepID=A0A1E7FDL1_9STRA|nr:hypothetical protein FRACYDRAFT_268939 [Fragilariopsis cylindrus CCMP1102]|eukprot:OEU16272.1 hypothetical protein FRACYDRAFT_268939 [Fragilariopsis cylindrus CCMP1102]
MASSLKEVTFGDITIREYPIILGDHPSCTGVPITIDWDYYGETTRNFELHEYHRSQHRVTGSGSKKHLFIPVQKRSQMLLDAGYTQQQIIGRALKVAEIKRLRAESVMKAQKEQLGLGKISRTLMTGLNNLVIGVRPKLVKATTITARSA